MDQNNKLVLAVIHEEDYEGVVTALNQHGFFVTKLASSGGFLRKKTVYTTAAMIPGAHMESGVSTVPVQTESSGVTVFTLSLDSLDKF